MLVPESGIPSFQIEKVGASLHPASVPEVTSCRDTACAAGKRQASPCLCEGKMGDVLSVCNQKNVTFSSQSEVTKLGQLGQPRERERPEIACLQGSPKGAGQRRFRHIRDRRSRVFSDSVFRRGREVGSGARPASSAHCSCFHLTHF